MPSRKANATIRPNDTIYVPYAWLLVTFLIFVSPILLSPRTTPLYPITSIPLHLFISIFVPTLAILVISHRYIAPERAAALLLTQPSDQREDIMRLRAILPAERVSSMLLGLLTAGTIMNSGDWTEFGAVLWWAGALFRWMMVGIMCMWLVEGGRGLFGEKRIEGQYVMPSLDKMHLDGRWTDIGLRVELYDVWVRKVDESAQCYEVRVSHASSHRRFDAGNAGATVGKVLRITL